MKPQFAKEIVNTEIKRPENESWSHPTYRPVESAVDWSVNRNNHYWKILRKIVESIEKCGYTVSITKDGKEYNK